MEQRDYETATVLLRCSNQLSPHFKTLELLGECLLELGNANFEAIVVLAAAAGLGNRPFRSYFLLARALNACGRTKEAIEKLDLALALQPDTRTARELREELLRRSQQGS